MIHRKTREKHGYRADIDGIRSLAVLSVFFFHLNPDFLPGGFLGVDVFFVISGYLITDIILRENHLRTFSFFRFYARRVKRIFPALFVVLLISACIATFLLPPETYSNFMESARYAAAQLANIFFAGEVGYFSEGFAEQPLLHTWSLGVEEQFYLFWPLLIFFCFKKRERQKAQAMKPQDGLASQECKGREKKSIDHEIAGVMLFLSVVSFAVCYVLAVRDHNLAFYMFYTRVFEFCIGGIIALNVIPTPSTKTAHLLSGTLGGFLICYSFLFVQEEYLGRSFLQFGVILPCIGTALVIIARPEGSVVNSFLATKVPASIGKISYSLYLYHWPVIIFWKVFSDTQKLDFSISLVIIAIALLLSTLSYLFVEQPARKSKLSDKFVLGLALVVIVVFTSTFHVMEDFKNAPWRIKEYDAKLPDNSEKITLDCSERTSNGIVLRNCNGGGGADAPAIALVGDSHSLHYLDSTITWATKNGYNFKHIRAAGCPSVLGDFELKSGFGRQHEKDCKVAASLFQTEIIDDPRVEIILIAQRFDFFYDGKDCAVRTRKVTFKDKDGQVVKDHTSYYKEQLAYTAETIQKAGKKLIILKQVPIFNKIDACKWRPRLKKVVSKERVCEYDSEFIAEWQQPSIAFIDNYIESYQIDAFDPTPYFTEPVQNNINLYFDKDHLNSFGSHYLGGYLQKYLDGIVSENL